jgi:DNA-binding NarL/FixJ family response regulator
VIAETTLLIADDHPIFRQGLRQVLKTAPQVTILAEAENGAQALRYLAQMRPDVAVIDVEMPEMDGFDVFRAARKAGVESKFIFLTLHDDELHFREAMDLGVNGYLIKDSAAADLVKCIRVVRLGQNYISPSLSTHLLKYHHSTRTAFRQLSCATLTATEETVLTHLAESKTSKEIAVELGISVRTVEKHRANICDKLNLRGHHALVKYANEKRQSVGRKKLT